MADDIKARVGEKESEILTGQIMMLNDPFMLSQMNDSIDAGNCAEAAVDAVCSLYADMFAGVDDELMRQRATDVRDIRTRACWAFCWAERAPMSPRCRREPSWWRMTSPPA